MKKFANITAVLLIFVLFFTGCTQNRETRPGPGIEIVERSQLMDEINTDVIMSEYKRHELEKHGIRISYENFRMTSDNSAEFDLIVFCGHNKYTLAMEGFLDYERKQSMGKDYFEKIRFYWGDIRRGANGTALVTGLKNAWLVNPERDDPQVVNMALPQTINGSDGIVLKGAVNSGGCSIVFHSDGKDYLWLGDKTGAERKTVQLPVGTGSLINIQQDSIIPFDREYRPVISFTGGNTLITGKNTAYYYNETAGTLLYGDPIVQLSTEEANIGFYKMQAEGEGKERHKGDFYIAVRTQQDKAESVFIAPSLLGDSRHEKNILVSDYGYTLVSQELGLEMDLNFAKGSVAALRYTIPREKLEEKMYISIDKSKALYSYAPEEWQGIQTYNIALSQEAQRQTVYVGCAGLINDAYPGETGFLSTEEIYVLGCDDYKIYSTSPNSVTKIFALSDKFPLGEDIDAEFTDRVLTAVVRNEKTKEITAVYYDTHKENPQYISAGDIRLESTYQLAFFDSEGNLIKTADTGINAFTGYNPVNINRNGNKVTISVTESDTDVVLTKAEYNIAKDKIALKQQYKK